MHILNEQRIARGIQNPQVVMAFFTLPLQSLLRSLLVLSTPARVLGWRDSSFVIESLIFDMLPLGEILSLYRVKIGGDDFVAEYRTNFFKRFTLRLGKEEKDGNGANSIGGDEQGIVFPADVRKGNGRNLVEENVDQYIAAYGDGAALGTDGHGHDLGNIDVMDRVVSEGVAVNITSVADKRTF